MPLPKDHRQSRAGRGHRGLCRPRGPTPTRRLHTAQFGSYGPFLRSLIGSTNERTPDLRTLSLDESRDTSRRPTRTAYAAISAQPVKSLFSRPNRATGSLRMVYWASDLSPEVGYTPGWEVPNLGS